MRRYEISERDVCRIAAAFGRSNGYVRVRDIEDGLALELRTFSGGRAQLYTVRLHEVGRGYISDERQGE